jgi:LPS export ABC transporter protein LptC
MRSLKSDKILTVNFLNHYLNFEKFKNFQSLCKLMVLLGCWIVFVSSCDFKDEIPKIPEFKGAMIETWNIETLFSDSAKIKMRLRGKRQLQFQNGNTEYPDGMEIDFYNPDGTKKTHLIANKGTFDKTQNVYTGIGHVVVEDKKEQKTLTSEELSWSPTTQRIFTKKYIEIRTKTQLLKGQGLEAKQDLSWYKILKPTGEVSLEDDE